MVLRLAALGYAEVCAGPFGIELAARAAGGVTPVLLVTAAALLLWVWPLIAITRALVACTPNVDGGCIGWVHTLLGPAYGHVNGYLTVFANALDLAIYPSLVAAYVPGDWGDRRIFAAAVVACGLVLVLSGLQCVWAVQMVCVVGVAALLVAWSAFATPLLSPNTFTDYYAAGDIDWGLLLSVTLWNFVGFTDAAAATATLKARPADYCGAFAGAGAAAALTYGVAVVAAGAVTPPGAWAVGSLVQAARVAGGQSLATGLLVAAVATNCMQYVTCLSMSALQTRAAAQHGVLPGRLFLSKYTVRGEQVPFICVVAYSVVSLSLSMFDLAAVVECAALLINAGLGLIAAAAFVVGCRLPACVVGLIIVGSSCVQSWVAWAVLAGCCWGALADYVFRHRRRTPAVPRGDANGAAAVDVRVHLGTDIDTDSDSDTENENGSTIEQVPLTEAV